MGASFVAKSFPASAEAALKARVASEVEGSAHEDGTSYSGEWGMKGGTPAIVPRRFSSDDEAEEWIIDAYPENDDPLVAVKVSAPVDDRSTKSLEKKIRELQARRNDYSFKLGQGCPFTPHTLFDRGMATLEERRAKIQDANVLAKIMSRVKQEKAQFKTCGACGSKISKQYIESLACPVCLNAEFLFTQTDKDRIGKIKDKISELEASEKEARKELSDYQAQKSEDQIKNGKWYWYVAGWCSS